MKSIAILIVLTVAAVVAPAAGYLAVSAYAEYKEASVRHQDLKRQQRDLEAYALELADYQRFASRVERFIETARAAGISEEGWNRHHVDIQSRVVSFDQLGRFIADANGGDEYYFLPSSLRIETGVGGGAANPFGRRSSSIARDEVRVSLVGDFLVPVR